jgi:hypothetical protein
MLPLEAPDFVGVNVGVELLPFGPRSSDGIGAVDDGG